MGISISGAPLPAKFFNGCSTNPDFLHAALSMDDQPAKKRVPLCDPFVGSVCIRNETRYGSNRFLPYVLLGKLPLSFPYAIFIFSHFHSNHQCICLAPEKGLNRFSFSR